MFTRYKRRRRRTMKRRYRRSFRRSTMRRRANTPEVKYVDINAINGSISVQNLAAATQTLYASDAFGPTAAGAGIFAAIAQGTGSNQRIGNKIKVKSISLHHLSWMCPASLDTGKFDSVICRILAAGVPTYFGGSDTTDFWSGNLTNHMHDFPRRSNYKIYLDKTLIYKNGTPFAGTDRAGKGAFQMRKFKLSFRNRVVEFKDGTNVPKYLEDRINFNSFAFSPSCSSTTQVLCYNYTMRVYYTDV